MELTVVRYERGPVARLWFNRPAVLNALTAEMLDQARFVVESVARDAEVRVLVLGGEGRGFCSGADLKATAVAGGDSPFGIFDRLTRASGPFVQSLRSCPQPVVAAVHGPAVGAGMSIALACDLIVASRSARFGQGFVKVGLAPDLGSFFFLPRIVGTLKARELMLFGELFDADEAKKIGLVNQVFEDDSFEQNLKEYCQRLAQGAPRSMAMVKRMLDRSHQSDLAATLHEEAVTQSLLRMSDDHQEGAKAFAQKRRPQFKGC